MIDDEFVIEIVDAVGEGEGKEFGDEGVEGDFEIRDDGDGERVLLAIAERPYGVKAFEDNRRYAAQVFPAPLLPF